MDYSALSKYRSELMGIAILWVMLFHTGLDFGIRPLNILRATGFGGVDIFIVLSAMGLVVSLTHSEQSFFPFMRRRAIRVLPAYFLVMLSHTIFGIVRGTAPLSALFWNSTLLSYWVRAEGSFNWYMSGIFLFYALTPFFFHWMKRTKHRTLFASIGILFGIALYRFLIYLDNWFYLDVAYRLPVFFLGLFIGFFVCDKRPLGKKDVLFWFFWLACGLIYVIAHQQLHPYTVLLPLGALFLFTTVPTCLLLCLLFDRLPLGMFRRLLRLIGDCSLEIYLLNVSFFAEITLLQQWLSLENRPNLYHLIAVPVNLALGILLHKIMARIQIYIQKPKAVV